MTYAEKLKDPRWQKKRLEIMERDSFMCRNCGDANTTLNVDHKVYRRGADPWDYPNDDLQTLCEYCHHIISETRKQITARVGQMNLWALQQLLVFIAHAPIGDEVLILQDTEPLTLPLRAWERARDLLLAEDEAIRVKLLLDNAAAIEAEAKAKAQTLHIYAKPFSAKHVKKLCDLFESTPGPCKVFAHLLDKDNNPISEDDNITIMELPWQVARVDFSSEFTKLPVVKFEWVDL